MTAAGVFVFFGIWHFASLVFVLFLLPETRGIPLEHVSNRWLSHQHTVTMLNVHSLLHNSPHHNCSYIQA